MTGRPLKELSQAERLLETGEYQKALDLVEKLLTQEDLSEDTRIRCLLLESQLRIKLGEFGKAHTIVNEILQTNYVRENALLTIDTLIVKAEALWRSGIFDEAFEAIEKGKTLLEETEQIISGEQEAKTQQQKAELLHHGGIISWYTGDLDRALEYHHRSLTLSEALDNKPGIASSFNNLGLVYWSKGDLDQALEWYQRSLKLNEQLGNKTSIAVIISNLGNVYARKGDLDQALEYQMRSLAIKEELGNKQEIFISLINLGVVYHLKGDLDQALEYYQKSLEIGEELEIKRDIALAINNIGSIHQLKGDLVQALECFQRTLKIYKELHMKEEVALSLVNIGETYRKQGNLKQATRFYQQSLKIYEELGNDPLLAIVLFELVWVTLEQQEPTLAQQYLQQLQQINERIDNRVIDQRYRIATALSLKVSKRARHRIKAGEILEQVVGEEVADHSLTVTAMIHLCDLLLSELKMTGEDELFEEIKDLTNRLLEISKQQASYSLLAETYLLQSKLALMELDMGQAKKLLAKAQSIANEKGLHTLARTVAHEFDLLQSKMQKWDLIVKEKPSRQELIDVTGLDDFLEQMIQTTVASLIEEKGIIEKEVPKKKYRLVYLDLLADSSKTEKTQFRVGIAQIGLSQTGDLLHEFYEEQAPGLFGLRKTMVPTVRTKIKTMIEKATAQGINLLIFPELTIDLNYEQLFEDLKAHAKSHSMYLIPGSYHNPKTKQNVSVLISPEGVLWEQTKHIPASIQFEKKRIIEGIGPGTLPNTTIIGNTELGRIAIVICRDFLDMDLRVELKNFEPPIDLIINPAFTPVTTDFQAAHFDARRSIYAYCFFANVAEFGDSLIYTPEKERTERTIPAKQEDLISKDIDLFKLRSERKKWELKQKRQRPFIQSTR